jgi:hypothetical protein
MISEETKEQGDIIEVPTQTTGPLLTGGRGTMTVRRVLVIVSAVLFLAQPFSVWAQVFACGRYETLDECLRLALEFLPARFTEGPTLALGHRTGSCATIPPSMLRKSQPLMSGFEWIIIVFIGIIPFRAAEVVAEALGCTHLVALACGIGVMAVCVLGYFAIRPMMLPD